MPDLMMPAATPITGSVFPQAEKAGLEASAPFAQEVQGLKQMGEDEETKQKAIKYRQLLHTGADGMRQYAKEVGQEFPDLGNQLGAEAEQYATFLQDPSLDAAKAEEYTHHFYDSANNRVKAIKDSKEAAVKPWAPATMDEAVDFDRKKRENQADFRAPAKPAAGDAARTAKRMNALRKIPAMWKQIEEMQTSGGEVPLIPGKALPDVRAYVESQPKAWRTRWDDLRGKLNGYETDAGLEATADVMGPDRENSDSYKLYKAPVGGGGAASTGGAVTPIPQPAPQNAIQGAVTWLKDPKNKADKRRAAILAEVQKAGVDTSGL